MYELTFHRGKFCLKNLSPLANGGWKACCPIHEDRRPSLVIYPDERHPGYVVVRCMAGCETQAVEAFIADAARPSAYGTGGGGRRTQIGPVRNASPVRPSNADFRHPDARKEPPRLETGNQNVKQQEAQTSYVYFNAVGKRYMRVVRREPGKRFHVEHWDEPAGGWRPGGPPTGTRGVYRLHEALASAGDAPIFIVEGEKDVDRLWAEGLAATCNVSGAGKWRDEYSPLLTDRRVVLIPDNDEPGRAHMNQVAASLQRYTSQIHWFEPPGVPEKGDISDWFDAGHTAAELIAAAVPAPTRRGKVIMERLSDVKPSEIDWIWPGRIAAGKITLLCGHPQLGKSFLTLAVAACLTQGWPLPVPHCDDPAAIGYADNQVPGSVAVLSSEDNAADTIVPRLMANGGDLSRVFHIRGMRIVERPSEAVRTASESRPTSAAERIVCLSEDVESIADALRTLENPRLLVIDPISAYLGDVDANRNEAVRSLLARIGGLAESLKIGVVLINHLRKSVASAHTLHQAIGSLAFTAMARLVQFVVADPDTPQGSVLVTAKSNISLPAPALKYHIDEGRISWDAFDPEFNLNDALTSTRTDRGASAAKIAAALDAHLGEQQLPVLELYDWAEQNGFGLSNLKVAKAMLGIKSRKVGKQWYWSRPENSAEIQQE